MKGTILTGDRVLFEDVEMQIEQYTDRKGEAHWRGSFFLPRRINQGKYDLRLDDGREGTIRTESIIPGASKTRVTFTGLRPLSAAPSEEDAAGE